MSTPPSAELRHQLHESDGKIVAMLLYPRVILEAWEFILRKRVNGKEMLCLCNSVAAALADCHHDRVNCGDEQDMWFAGRLAAGGNIESLTREAPQPDSLQEPLHFRRAYGMVMRELLTAQDAEEERDAQDLYWKSDIKVPLTLVETSQDTAPVPPAAWPSRVRKASCILQEKSISRDRERELRVKVDPSNAFSLSSKVKTDSLNSRAGCLTGGTSSSNWPGRPCRPRMIMSAVQTWSTWATRAGVLKSFPSAVTDAEKSRFADFEVAVRKLGHVGPSFHEYSQGLEHSRYLCWINGRTTAWSGSDTPTMWRPVFGQESCTCANLVHAEQTGPTEKMSLSEGCLYHTCSWPQSDISGTCNRRSGSTSSFQHVDLLLCKKLHR